jgi:hypothetical protein
MKIQKDNLTPKQKRNAYLGIIIMSIFFFSLFYYIRYINENKRELLSKNTETTFCRIIGSNSHKGKQNFLEYNVNGKNYETRQSSSRIFNIGEFYKIKYSKSNPEISEVDYTKPIIFKKEEFYPMKGIIIKTYESKRLSVLSFKYKYGNKNYERDVILERIGNLKKGNEIKILVNRKNPKISYLEGKVKIK